MKIWHSLLARCQRRHRLLVARRHLADHNSTLRRWRISKRGLESRQSAEISHVKTSEIAEVTATAIAAIRKWEIHEQLNDQPNA